MTLYEFNADEASFDVLEYVPETSPAIGGFLVVAHHRLGPHDAARMRHNFRRYYEGMARIQLATIEADHSRFERADRAWRMEIKR